MNAYIDHNQRWTLNTICQNFIAIIFQMSIISHKQYLNIFQCIPVIIYLLQTKKPNLLAQPDYKQKITQYITKTPEMIQQPRIPGSFRTGLLPRGHPQAYTNYSVSKCEVKSRYMGSWDKRQVRISLDEKFLEMANMGSNKVKRFNLAQVNFFDDGNAKYAKLRVPNGREYEFKKDLELDQVLQYVQYYKNYQAMSRMVDQIQMPLPKKLNYYATIRSSSLNQDYMPQHRSSILLPKVQTVETVQSSTIAHTPQTAKTLQVMTAQPLKSVYTTEYTQPLMGQSVQPVQIMRQPVQAMQKPVQAVQVARVYQRRPSYILENDWRRDERKGGLVFINNQKKSMISKMISYIVKRVISTGSFMGISFPTFAMKPQTILQTYCKCLGAAPLLFDHLGPDPLERIKAFNCLILTISIQFNDIQKPFNPTIGQTFQGQIGGYNVYAQQISHHPPISSFMLDGKNYILHGTLQLNANLGINSAVGLFYGDIVMEFDDGGVVRGRMPSGTLNGMVFGETKFGPSGACYSFDPINHIVSSYEVKDKDIMVGNIGILKPHNYQQFRAITQSKTKQKYQKFKNINQKQFSRILSKMQVVWTNNIKYDNKPYFNYSNPQNLPIKLTQNIQHSGQRILPSDSSFRRDVKLRQALDMDGSQNEKDRIEDEERALRKMRDGRKGIVSKNSL